MVAYALIPESPLYRIVTAQFIATLLASALCWVVDGVAAYSALLGGLVCVVPGLYMVIVSLRARQSARLGSVIRGEVGKFALTAALFALVFVFIKPLNVLAFFGTFGGLQLLYAIIPVVMARRLLGK